MLNFFRLIIPCFHPSFSLFPYSCASLSLSRGYSSFLFSCSLEISQMLYPMSCFLDPPLSNSPDSFSLCAAYSWQPQHLLSNLSLGNHTSLCAVFLEWVVLWLYPFRMCLTQVRCLQCVWDVRKVEGWEVCSSSRSAESSLKKGKWIMQETAMAWSNFCLKFHWQTPVSLLLRSDCYIGEFGKCLLWNRTVSFVEKPLRAPGWRTSSHQTSFLLIKKVCTLDNVNSL